MLRRGHGDRAIEQRIEALPTDLRARYEFVMELLADTTETDRTRLVALTPFEDVFASRLRRVADACKLAGFGTTSADLEQLHPAAGDRFTAEDTDALVVAAERIRNREPARWCRPR